MTQTNTTRLFRIENSRLATKPDGVVSQDLIGQWFTPHLYSAATYLRKSTQTFGKNSHVVDGARLVAVDVPSAVLPSLHVSAHLVASQMDVEGDNYLIPGDADYPRIEVNLDGSIGDLRGKLGNHDYMEEARRRLQKIVEGLGEISIDN